MDSDTETRAGSRCGSSCVSKSPVFYGYIQAIVATIGLIGTGPGQTPVVGTAISPVTNELQLPRTLVSTLYLVATLCSAATLPFVGRLLDHVGPPPLFAIAAFGLGVTCVLFSQFVHSSYSLCVAFYCLRLFGQGALTLVCQNAIILWFNKKRGRVMGMCSFMNSLCLTGLFSSIVKSRISAEGWRNTYFKLGLFEVLLILPLGAILLKQRPQVYGLTPDGPDDEQSDAPASAEVRLSGAAVGQESILSDASGETKPRDFTFPESIRTLAFWAMSTACFSAAAFGTALFFHLDAIFEDSPYNTHLNFVYLSSSVSAAGTTLVAGYFVDKIRPQFIMFISMLANATMLGTAAMILWFQAGPAWLLFLGIFNGMSSGSCNLCANVSYAKWFGTTHNGKIQGFANALVVLGSAVGPAMVSAGFDWSGDYGIALSACAVFPLICALLSILASDPDRKKLVSG